MFCFGIYFRSNSSIRFTKFRRAVKRILAPILGCRSHPWRVHSTALKVGTFLLPEQGLSMWTPILCCLTRTSDTCLNRVRQEAAVLKEPRHIQILAAGRIWSHSQAWEATALDQESPIWGQGQTTALAPPPGSHHPLVLPSSYPQMEARAQEANIPSFSP